MGKAKAKRSAVPPCIEAIIRLGGPTKAARKLGAPVKPATVVAWMRECSIPMGWVRRVAKLSGVPLEAFFAFEEARAKGPPMSGGIRSAAGGA